jgi:hypothetical protein
MASQPKLGIAFFSFLNLFFNRFLVTMIIGIGLCESGIRFVSGRRYNNFK